mgnify:CR=1 FL=1
MKYSILGTNGFLSTAIARYCNNKGYELDMYGLDKPTEHKYDNFYKVNLMDTDLDCSKLLSSDVVIYAIGAGIQSNLKENYNLIYNLNVTAPVLICNKLKELDYIKEIIKGVLLHSAVFLKSVRQKKNDSLLKRTYLHLHVQPLTTIQ